MFNANKKDMKRILITFSLILSVLSYGQEIEQEATPKIKFYNQTSVGLVTGLSSNQGILSTSGIVFKNRIGVGVGAGIEGFRYQNYVTLLLDGRYDLLKSRTGPYVQVSSGFVFPTYRMHDYEYLHYGFSSGISLGMNVFFTKHLAISTSIGYRFNFYQVPKTYWWGWGMDQVFSKGENMEIYNLNRLELRVGITIR
jgi:hypothetical protein